MVFLRNQVLKGLSQISIVWKITVENAKILNSHPPSAHDTPFLPPHSNPLTKLYAASATLSTTPFRPASSNRHPNKHIAFLPFLPFLPFHHHSLTPNPLRSVLQRTSSKQHGSFLNPPKRQKRQIRQNGKYILSIPTFVVTV